MANLTPKDINAITDFESLLRFLHDKLDWPVDPSKTIEDVTFDYTADELRVQEAAAARLHGGIVRQLRDFRPDQKIGIFFVEFDNANVYATSLRQILRGLIPNRRQSGQRRTWAHENLLFICSTKDYEQFTFAHFSGEKHTTAKLSLFGWERGDTHLRTLCEFNLPALSWPSDPQDAEAWLKKWASSFDVERVTDRFFDSYREVFEAAEREVKKSIKDAETARLYTQRLFNRLMFIYFIQKKGWLSFNGDSKYLRALFNDADARDENFFSDRLYWLFFRGMGVADLDLTKQTKEELAKKRGVVPPLNGGLFEIEDQFDERGKVALSNDAFAPILNLFERYNFTVEESTPLDVQVAVDPEMLGKVFEELVTGRHETGSYYTPRAVVSFMCREALKHYLDTVQSDGYAVARFVDEEDAGELQNPEAVLDALKRVRVCDPACGSGAYLLGMLHELTRLRAALFKSKKIDDATLYERKRWIIENNLYGVDIDKFAVQIACLRLWLSLAIESDEPHPLPNLDFKIGCGDSLIAPAPSEAEKQMTFARTSLVNDFRQAKGEYMRETDPDRKRKLRQRIEDLRSEIALALKHKSPTLSEGQIQKKRQELAVIGKSIESARNPTIKVELKKQAEKIEQTLVSHERASKESETGFDWTVEFAEVFTPASRERWRLDDLHPMLNDFKRQGTLVEEAQPDLPSGGFDIVLANPPYVRADAQFKHIKNEKERQAAISNWKAFRAALLKTRFYETIYEKWDLYLPFLERAYQLLREDGDMVFIISDAYNASKYASRSHDFFVSNASIERIDFCTGIPLFKAGVNNTIVHFAKAWPGGNHPIRVQRWGQSSDEFERNAQSLPTGLQTELGPSLFRQDSTDAQSVLTGTLNLQAICYVSVGMVIHCDEKKAQGLFKAEDLVSEKQDRKHPKPYVEGKDLARWHVQRVRFLEYGTKRAPSMFRRPTFPELHGANQRLLALRMCGETPIVAFDDQKLLSNHTVIVFVPWHCLRGVRNKSIKKTAKYRKEVKGKQPLVLREEMEEISNRFRSKYLLAIMNSTFAKRFVNARRRSKLDVYPDDWKLLPIAPISLEEQQPFEELVDAILDECKKHGYPLPAGAAVSVKKLEREIDERVAALYGVPFEGSEKTN